MGFFEILLIAVVALFVVGPERMPEAVRSVVLTIGRIKRSFNSARTELEKQIGADDIRRQLHNESVMESLGKIRENLSDIDKKIDTEEADIPCDEQEYDYAPGHHHKQLPDDNAIGNHTATDKANDKMAAKKESWAHQNLPKAHP